MPERARRTVLFRNTIAMEEVKKVSTVRKVMTGFGIGFVALLVISAVNGRPLLPEAERLPAIQAWYKQVKNVNDSVSIVYGLTVEKIAKGDAEGAYLDFKGVTGESLRLADDGLFKLRGTIPSVPDRKLLEDTAKNLWMANTIRIDVMGLYNEGVEKGDTDLILKAGAEGKRSDQYLVDGLAGLNQIAAKYSLK